MLSKNQLFLLHDSVSPREVSWLDYRVLPDLEVRIAYSSRANKPLTRTRQPNLGPARVRKDNTDTQWSLRRLPSDAREFPS